MSKETGDDKDPTPDPIIPEDLTTTRDATGPCYHYPEVSETLAAHFREKKSSKLKRKRKKRTSKKRKKPPVRQTMRRKTETKK